METKTKIIIGVVICVIVVGLALGLGLGLGLKKDSGSAAVPAAAGTTAPAAASAVPTGMITGKIVQVARADNKAEYINILGIDIFDQSGARITTGITPTITPAIYANNPAQFGPQFLIDGIHAETGGPAGLRLPHSTNVPNAAMTLDLGSDKVISKIVIYNRTACCMERINGCNLIVKKADGTTVLTIPLSGSKAIYTFSAPLTNTSTSSTYAPEPYSLF
jgi:hypothetical protein